jgi:mRNA interferase MazF
MKRGDLYRVPRGNKYDPKKYRVYVIVGRQKTVDSGFSSVICAPIYTNFEGYSTQLPVGIDEGLKHDSAIYCDELTSIRKSTLTNYIGTLSVKKLIALNDCLAVALALDA